ncbi:hypothetical protein C8F04DRAFT_1180609 [Mycena alexandri]|uniref:Uncharacterized protein n=1 Tax=Mycena alexandri TaxID=1745969 RepID=A0AAD6T2G5_9AGAR|nr:hypothetical protein C8F04DRAFT_1180609 [Mycena alexandri]
MYEIYWDAKKCRAFPAAPIRQNDGQIWTKNARFARGDNKDEVGLPQHPRQNNALQCLANRARQLVDKAEKVVWSIKSLPMGRPASQRVSERALQTTCRTRGLHRMANSKTL